MSAEKRRIFLSFSRTVEALEAKKIVPDQLVNGLFFLGCPREHTLDHESVARETLGEGDPEKVAAESGWDSYMGVRQLLQSEAPRVPPVLKWLESMSTAQEIVVKELRAGEKERRVMYRLRRPALFYPRLNRLLVANGLPALTAPTEKDYQHFGRGSMCMAYRGKYREFFLDGYNPGVAARLINEQLAGMVEVVVSR